jgi:AhpD family alkylhydroperoxidase
MYGLQKHVNAGSLPVQLHELVKMRASQINGCAFCLDLHARVAREHGESDRRLHLLNAWRDADYRAWLDGKLTELHHTLKQDSAARAAQAVLEVAEHG